MKSQLCLYIDVSIKANAIAKGLNLSKAFEQFLAIEMNESYKGTDKDKIIAQLKNKIAILSVELNNKTEECIKLNKKIPTRILRPLYK